MNRRDNFDPKTAFVNPDLQERFRFYSRVFAGIVIIMGVIPLLGWLVDLDHLTRIYPSLPQMRLTTSFQLALSGIALLFATYPKRRIVYLTKDLLAFLVAFIGAITLFEFVTDDTSILSEVVYRAIQSTAVSVSPVPPTVSSLFILAGLTILFLDISKKKGYFQYLILIAFIIILPSIIEHFYGIDFIYGFALHTKMALHVTIAMILLFVGILFSRPQVGFMAVMTSGSAGGYLARRMLITALFLPLLVGGIVFLGNRFGFYDTEIRFLLFVALTIIVFTNIVWRSAKSIHILDLERRQSEQSVYRLAAIVESSDDAIIGRDLKGTITDWNRGAEELYGYKAKEVIGQQITFLFPKNAKKELIRFNKQLKSGKSVKEQEAIRLTKDGSSIPVSVTASPIKNNYGKVIGVSTISRDISERKQVERQRELFIGIASHELKTPVTSTKAYTQLLKRHFEKRKDKESLEYLTKMDSQLNKLTELISYLLDVSTIQKGQLQLNLQKFNIDDAVEDTIEELQRTTTSHSITKIGKIRRNIVGDKSRLTQVLRNLLANAIKYSPDAKKVDVICSRQDKIIRVEIVDYGIGIPKAEQRKVFDPLYRSTDAKRENFSGLGLGLYISKEIIRKHGGTLSLKSMPGKGTSVTITLPIQSKKYSRSTS